MKIINLTPHAITIHWRGSSFGESRRIEYPPDQRGPARVEQVELDRIGLAPDTDGWADVVTYAHGPISGLPAPEKGVIYIVSAMVAELAGRDDVLSPDSGPTAIRAIGQVVAVTQLRAWPSKEADPGRGEAVPSGNCRCERCDGRGLVPGPSFPRGRGESQWWCPRCDGRGWAPVPQVEADTGAPVNQIELAAVDGPGWAVAFSCWWPQYAPVNQIELAAVDGLRSGDESLLERVDQALHMHYFHLEGDPARRETLYRLIVRILDSQPARSTEVLPTQRRVVEWEHLCTLLDIAEAADNAKLFNARQAQLFSEELKELENNQMEYAFTPSDAAARICGIVRREYTGGSGMSDLVEASIGQENYRKYVVASDPLAGGKSSGIVPGRNPNTGKSIDMGTIRKVQL